MPNARSKVKSKRQGDALPQHFSSLDAAAEFWDTHDSADYEKYMRDVECDIDIKRSIYQISLDSELYNKIKSIAEARGVSAETLVNLWIQEKAS